MAAVDPVAKHVPPKETKESPEERAAKVPPAKFGEVMAEGNSRVQEGLAYDWQFYKALVKRWMEHDAAGCLQWIGQMKMEKTGWGDPFNVLFAGEHGLSPKEALQLIDSAESLPRNKRRMLNSLAEWTGAERAGELGDILQVLPKGSVRDKFLQSAMKGARPSEIATWIELVQAGEDPKRLVQDLMRGVLNPSPSRWRVEDGKLVESGGGDWEESMQLILDETAETPFAQLFESRILGYQSLRDMKRLRALVKVDAKAALEEYVKLQVEQGVEAGEARELGVRELQKGSKNWGVRELNEGLQQVVLGHGSLPQLLEDRFQAARDELPEEFWAAAQQRVIEEAVHVAPRETVEFALQQGMKDELGGMLERGVKAQQLNPGQRGEVLLALMDGPSWELVSNGQRLLVNYAVQRMEGDQEAGLEWLRAVAEDEQRTAIARLARDTFVKRERTDLVDLLDRFVPEQER